MGHRSRPADGAATACEGWAAVGLLQSSLLGESGRGRPVQPGSTGFARHGAEVSSAVQKRDRRPKERRTYTAMRSGASSIGALERAWRPAGSPRTRLPCARREEVTTSRARRPRPPVVRWDPCARVAADEHALSLLPEVTPDCWARARQRAQTGRRLVLPPGCDDF
jgi:hypothetical protein